MRITPHRLDVGVRRAVKLLNAIDGVTTRASCEGRANATRQPHSTLAYVAFEYPMPLRLREFLVSELGGIGRVDDDRVYCRWPAQNRQFLELLSSAGERYGCSTSETFGGSVAFCLAALQSDLLALGTAGREAVVTVCASCADVGVASHDCGNRRLEVFNWPAGFSEGYFLDFLAEQGNHLDAALLAALGGVKLEERTRHGDFGSPYRQRWLHYRNARVHHEMINALRNGIQAFRDAGRDFDVLFEAGSARVTWNHEPHGFKP